MRCWALWWLGCAGCLSLRYEDPKDVAAVETDVPPDPPLGDTEPVETEESDPPPQGRDVPPLPWSDDPCAGLPAPNAYFEPDLARFDAQDALTPPPKGQVVLAGSSSVRRWEGAFEALAPWGAVQRGVGGASITDVAGWVDRLILPHQPSGVVLFAGTNDIAAGVAPEVVVAAWRCVVQRVFDAGEPVPVVYIGITPTPSRWTVWPQADGANQAIAALAAQHPLLGYVDPTSFFGGSLGQPPDSDLFDSDQLHLSARGYTIWTDNLLPVLTQYVSERVPSPVAPLARQTRIRVDFGPSNPEDGAPAPAVDGFGIHWNAWHPAQGGAQVIAGEALRGLRTTSGAATDVDVVVTGGFRSNGYRNGGLRAPPGEHLGTLAVPEATGDFFFIETTDDPGALAFTGLDPAARYTLRLFASRATTDERRVTRFVAGGRSVDLVTSGPDVGHGGYDGNDSEVAVLRDLAPDRWGQLYLDVQRLQGAFAYLSLVELEVE